jgi:hypothetical protein
MLKRLLRALVPLVTTGVATGVTTRVATGVTTGLALAVSGSVSAQAPEAPPMDLPAWETDHPFADIPHPRDVFGFEPGADHRLATHDQIVEYFRALDAASDRVVVEEIGESVLGRPLILAYISSAENVARLEELRATAEVLARARIPEAEARARAASGKAVIWVDGGLHATEVAGAQHSPLLAYRVAGEETEEMRRIRDDVVLLLMPVMNPDGLDMVADWTERSRGTEWEGSRPPVLYQYYTGHDNNRDWFMITQPETRAVADVVYERWYPQIVLNQHQAAPWPARIFIPPFTEPVNPHIPPLVVRGVNAVGNAMGTRLSEEDKPGAIARVNFDMWWNGGMRTAPYFHNMVGILTETAHPSVAPRYTEPSSLPDFIDETIPARAPSVFYPDPWLGGWFRLRDAVEYMVTAAVGTLDIASELREDWLLNIWRMGREAIVAGEAGDPFAYIVPPDQRNPMEAVDLVNILRRGGVEVHRSEGPFHAGGARFPGGSYVVFAGQAFRPYIMDLMEKHEYPDLRLYRDGPPDTPYDITGWTLPIQMQVRVARVDEPFEAEGIVPVDVATVWPGTVEGDGRWGWALSAASNAAVVAVNRLLRDGARVAIAPDGVLAGDREMGPGAYVIRAGTVTPERLDSLATALGIDFVGIRREPRSTALALELPRVGVYKSWMASSDEGWTRWMLDTYEFAVDTLHDAEIREADLSRYHAIILPDQRAESILHGHEPGSRPAGMTGGIGLEGMLRLKRYIEDGGRLIAFDGSAQLLIDQLALPVRNVVEGLPSEQFFVPGTLLALEVDEDDPLGWGMPTDAAAFFVRSSAFSTTGAEPEVAARYARENTILTGWALGEERLAGQAALVRVPLGSGDVVLFGFRPQFRGQPRGTFKLVFNALHGAALSDGTGYGGQ